MQLSANSRKTRDDNVKTTLTSDQAQEWEKIKTEQKAEHHQNH